MFIEGYKPRVLDKTVSNYLSAFGAVCIEGPKWCGKTWTSRFNSSSEFRVASPDNNFQNRELAQMAPNMVLQGEAPRLIDEWQEGTSLWDAVRYEVDKIIYLKNIKITLKEYKYVSKPLFWEYK